MSDAKSYEMSVFVSVMREVLRDDIVYGYWLATLSTDTTCLVYLQCGDE